jgi:hypothetical protein
VTGLATITFNCGCGENLYRISTDILALNADFRCACCGQEYKCRDGLIAFGVPVIREEALSTHTRPDTDSGT